MCGIFGFVAQSERPSSVVVEGLRFLEYRGYDSWGVAVARGHRVEIQKAIGTLAAVETALPPSQVALGHTRWATHGGVTTSNAHPHIDCSGRLALIHNGIVENYRALAARLERPHSFRSQTDTEVLIHLIEELMDSGMDLLESLIRVFRQVEGLSAVAVLDAAGKRIAVAKNGSPICLGWSSEAYYLVSDPIALLDHTRCVTFLHDGQAALLSTQGLDILNMANGSTVVPERQEISWDTRQAGLNGFNHFMEKEIHEQPDVLRSIAHSRTGDCERLADEIARAAQTFIIGCGTAHHAALSGRYILAEIAGVSVATAVASEMSLILPELGPRSLVVALSQSGETIDVLEALKVARGRGARIAAITNAEGSSLHRFADSAILLQCGPERCVLATKSYTAKLAVLYMTACQLAGTPERGSQLLTAAADRMTEMLNDAGLQKRLVSLVRTIGNEQHLFILGRHRNYPLALEAALKIKEVSYMHAEGFAAGELKHGVIALVTHGTPCMILAPDGDFRREALAAAAEVSARGAYTIGLSPVDEAEFDISLAVSGESGVPFEIALLTQLLAYHLAVLRGCDPDKPRNLAKCVTVK